jgi:hypothetical protein
LYEKLKERYPQYAKSRANIHNILKNRFYIGYQSYAGEIFPHIYEQFIDKNIFVKAQEILKKNSNKEGQSQGKQKNQKHDKYYRALIKCSECLCLMTGSYAKGYIYYCCTGARQKHPKKYVREEHITQQLQEIFNIIGLDLLQYLYDYSNLRLVLRNTFKELLIDSLGRIVWDIKDDFDKDKVLQQIEEVNYQRENPKKVTIKEREVEIFISPIQTICLGPRTAEEIAYILKEDLNSICMQLIDLQIAGLIDQTGDGKWQTT